MAIISETESGPRKRYTAQVFRTFLKYSENLASGRVPQDNIIRAPSCSVARFARMCAISLPFCRTVEHEDEVEEEEYFSSKVMIIN